MNDIRDILKERGSRYGDFKTHADIAQKLKLIWVASPGADIVRHLDRETAAVINEGMDMVFHKIARICNGDPTYIDSYTDIIGYTQLIIDHLNREEACEGED